MEDEIEEAGARIIWVLEQAPTGQQGTAELCRDFVESRGSSAGLCVGDDQTIPEPGTFDHSPFSIQRGFDMIVPRSTMQIVWTTTHGTPTGNENPSGEEVLQAVREAIDAL